MRVALYFLFAMTMLTVVGCSEMARNAKSTEATASIENGEHFAAEFTSSSFQTDVLDSPQVVLVDCWAPWCGPCLKLGPTIEELAREYKGRALIGKLNVDNAKELSAKYDIDGIPALLFFLDGEVVDRLVGLQPKSAIAAKLDRLIAGSHP